jgi:hypothetical protein
MTLQPELLDLFDGVMRDPRSSRGIDVNETCRLLAERVRAVVPAADYKSTMTQL